VSFSYSHEIQDEASPGIGSARTPPFFSPLKEISTKKECGGYQHMQVLTPALAVALAAQTNLPIFGLSLVVGLFAGLR
jgi:hypothetical protein